MFTAVIPLAEAGLESEWVGLTKSLVGQKSLGYQTCDTNSSSSHVGKVPSMPWASVSPILDGQVWWSVSIMSTLGGGKTGGK